MTQYEIGVVYRKGSRLFLAMSERTLITFKDGELVEIKPAARYDAVRSISVEDLCGRWGITLDDLDQITSRYLMAAAAEARPRPRGSRRQRVADEFAWKTMRMIRISRAS